MPRGAGAPRGGHHYGCAKPRKCPSKQGGIQGYLLLERTWMRAGRASGGLAQTQALCGFQPSRVVVAS
jgi:hypothetical protein